MSIDLEPLFESLQCSIIHFRHQMITDRTISDMQSVLDREWQLWLRDNHVHNAPERIFEVNKQAQLMFTEEAKLRFGDDLMKHSGRKVF